MEKWLVILGIWAMCATCAVLFVPWRFTIGTYVPFVLPGTGPFCVKSRELTKPTTGIEKSGNIFL